MRKFEFLMGVVEERSGIIFYFGFYNNFVQFFIFYEVYTKNAVHY